MQSKFMFLFLSFFLIVTCCTFESNSPFDTKTDVASVRPPLGTVTKIILPPKPEIAPPLIPKTVSEFTTEVMFTKGKESLPNGAKTAIKDLFYKAKKVGKIYSAKIISWGDQLRHPKKNRSLSSAQLKLVEDRNDNLEAYLENLDLHLTVRKISMAEKPEVMDGLLSQDDKKLKKHLDNAIPNASRSIVMFVLKKAKK